MRIIPFLFLILFSLPAYAEDNCEDIIRWSTTREMYIKNKDAFDEHADRFCKEYSEKKSSNDASNYGLSYKVLSASFGDSSSSVVDIASKVCSQKDAIRSSTSAYQRYIEYISPDAYPAYLACKNSPNIKFSLSFMLPKQLGITVNFRPDVPIESAKVAYKSTTGITCAWSEDSQESINVKQGMTSFLICNRDTYQTKGFVVVYQEDGHDKLRIPWREYNDKGVPVDRIRDIQNEISVLKRRLEDSAKLIDSLISKTDTNGAYISQLKSKKNVAASTISSHDGIWGDWRSIKMCPTGQYVCGLRSRFEPSRGNGDDTALNAVRLKCCKFLD